MEMIITPTIQDYEIHIPQEYLNKKVKLVLLPIENEDYKYWSEKEIKNIGKIGFISSSFEEDSEDYSKW